MSRLFRDLSFSAISAGFIAVLVGFASATAIVFQAAQAAGADQQMMVSWVWALGIGMGVSSLGLSLYYKTPVIIAWSTPGAALLATSLVGASMEQAIGIFVFVAVLTLLIGMTGWFDKLTKRLPLPLASAMLAGILLQFGLKIFTSMQGDPLLVVSMFAVFLAAKRWLPRYAIVLVLITGFAIAFQQGQLNMDAFTLELATPIWVTPQFDLPLLIGIGLPLFLVTMSSQNLPGVATLRASGYDKQPISPLITASGATNLVLAPFGGFAFNLAAITAAICTSEESHPDKSRRYVAGVSSGIFNIIAGLLGASVVGLFAAFPAALVAALAGLALLGTIAMSLKSSVDDPGYREPALITLLVTASGVSFFGIASAFWGLLFGVAATIILRKAKS